MSAIVDCKHFVDGKQVPCPPMCPTQSNPMRMKTWLGRLLWLRAIEAHRAKPEVRYKTKGE